MTTITTRPTCRRTTPATGSCRWLCDNPRDLLLAGLSAPLSITVSLKDGPKTDFYWLTRHVNGGWLLTKEAEDGESAAHYNLDAELWRCSCPDRRAACGDCKHARSVSAALRKAGIS